MTAAMVLLAYLAGVLCGLGVRSLYYCATGRDVRLLKRRAGGVRVGCNNGVTVVTTAGGGVP